MRDDVLNHEIWVSFGGKGGKARGTVKAKKVSIRKIHEQLFDQPSVDNSLSFADYVKLDESKEGKAIQAEKKAAAGFIIAGKFKDGRRKITHQIGRSAIQIDIDYATPEQAEFILDGSAEINEWAYVWHTTRAHCQQKPRIRIIVPLDRMVNGDEANALTRYLALTLADDPSEAIEIPDLVSFRYNQIMYRPSISKGQDYLHGINADAPILKVDEFLADHPDWTDISKLPRQEEEKTATVATGGTKMEDPTAKDGIVGAFCRAFSIQEAIEEFLHDIYVPGDCSTEIRYTYALGSAANGLVIYDDLFAHSHHGTDPAEGQNNAWDLVRKHLFIGLDEDTNGNTSPGNMPSFKAMVDLAMKDERVRKERAASLAFDDDEFDDIEDDDEDEEPQVEKTVKAKKQGKEVAPRKSKLDDLAVDDLLDTGDDDEEESLDDEFDDIEDDDEPEEPKAKKKKAKAKDESPWQERLVLDKADMPEKSRYNVALIVSNDRRIAPTVAYNELTGGPYVRSPLRFSKVGAHQAPVDDPIVGRRWTDADTAALNVCLSAPTSLKGYGRDFARQDIEDAMLLAAQENSYNPVLDTIHQVEWDGEKRLGTMFHRFLGSPDTPYVREMEILFFLAGITRLYEPGHPFHLVPILGGKQGGGKTGFIKAIAFESKFYGELSGDFSNLQKMVESTRGKWITEMPELKGIHRGMIQDIKQYFTSEKDTVRLAYRRNEEDFYRRNVTIGTTNEDEYLRDDENRRFCPIPVTVDQDNVLDFAAFIPLVPQLWAEADHLYLEMRKARPKGQLDLNFKSAEAKREARERQQAARETMIHEPVAEVVQEWLDTPISAEALAANDPLVDDFDGETGSQMFVRNYVTATMIRRQLGTDPVIRDLRMSPDKVIGMALRAMGDWVALGPQRRLGRMARWYVREGLDNNEEYVPLVSIRGQGAAPEPSVDDLMG